MALVMTLLVVALLVTAVLEFDRATRTTVQAAGNFRDGMKAFHLATSGVAAAQAVLQDDHLRHGASDSLTELWATPFPPYPLGDGTIAVAIQDEGGKFNVNSLVTPTGGKVTLQVEMLKHLFTLKGLDPGPVDAIVDWVDRDDISEPNGAETAYYAGLERPYACRNGPIETLSELHLVKGMTDEIYRATASLLTVYRNGASGRLNINTADPLVLQSLPYQDRGVVSFPLDDVLVEKIIAGRPFASTNEINKITGLDPKVLSQILPWLHVGSTHFSVYTEGTANGVKKAVQAVVDRTTGMAVLRYWRLAD